MPGVSRNTKSPGIPKIRLMMPMSGTMGCMRLTTSPTSTSFPLRLSFDIKTQSSRTLIVGSMLGPHVALTVKKYSAKRWVKARNLTVWINVRGILRSSGKWAALRRCESRGVEITIAITSCLLSMVDLADSFSRGRLVRRLLSVHHTLVRLGSTTETFNRHTANNRKGPSPIRGTRPGLSPAINSGRCVHECTSVPILPFTLSS